MQQSIDQLNKLNDEFKAIEKPTAKEREITARKSTTLTEQLHNRAKALADEGDQLFPFTKAGDGSEGHRIPVIHIRAFGDRAGHQSGAGRRFGHAGKADRRRAQAAQRGDLTGWKIKGETAVERVDTPVKNVVGVLEGEGPLAEETIVIGAHYDHLGHGGTGSLDPGSTEIHHGADDNASGAAALVEVARQLAGREKKLPRRIVFIAFTGEERGLLGSARYVRDPLVPLDKTIAMLNMDMVGRLVDDKLVIYGNGTAEEFDSLLNNLNEKYAFKITRHPEGFGPSDHSSFYAKQIPVLHFFTGTHSDYHRPTDTAEKINVDGMRRVADMVAEAAVTIAQADQRPTYKEVKGKSQIARGGDRPYFGSVPDFSQDQPGYALTAVTKGGPAETSGLEGRRHHRAAWREQNRQLGRFRQRLAEIQSRRPRAGDRETRQRGDEVRGDARPTAVRRILETVFD